MYIYIFFQIYFSESGQKNFAKNIEIIVEAAALNSKPIWPPTCSCSICNAAPQNSAHLPALFVLFFSFFNFWEKTDSNQLMRLRLFVTEHVLSTLICISLHREADAVQRGPALILIPPNNNPANSITKGYYAAACYESVDLQTACCCWRWRSAVPVRTVGQRATRVGH